MFQTCNKEQVKTFFSRYINETIYLIIDTISLTLKNKKMKTNTITLLMAGGLLGLPVVQAEDVTEQTTPPPAQEATANSALRMSDAEKADFAKVVRAYNRVCEINQKLEQLPIPAVDDDVVAVARILEQPFLEMLSSADFTADKLAQVRKSAESGNDKAQLLLGVLYMMGYEGMEQDFNKALSLFIQSAKKGNDMALTFLGCLYASLELSEEYTQLGLLMLEHAANENNIIAMYQMAMINLIGVGGVEQDLEKAQYWYDKVAESPEAEQFEMALAMVVQQFESAAEAGDINAQLLMGFFSYMGIFGVEEDNEAALKWFHAAAAQNSADAQYALGCIYEDGEIVPQDLKLAEEWYSKAAAQGMEEAKQDLEALRAKK